MEVWKIIFPSKRVICRFHVNLPGCKGGHKGPNGPNVSRELSPAGPEVVISNVEGQVIEGFGGAFTESSAAVYKTGGGSGAVDIRVQTVPTETWI